MAKAYEDKFAEIDRNLEAFLKVLPQIAPDHAGKYALMHGGAIIEYFETALDAQIAGNNTYDSADFSIQRVESDPEELGFYAYALHTR